MKQDLYTLRWHINHWSDESKTAALEILARLLGESAESNPAVLSSSPVRRPAAGRNARDLWYPSAARDFPASRTRGKYPKGGPEGAIVHWTAGRPEQSLAAALAYQAQQGYTYFCIDQDGNVGQNFPLDRWGYHAGKSYWPGLGASVSNRLVGVEVLCPGTLDGNNAPWFDKGIRYAPDKVRITSTRESNISPGRYYKYTEAQEQALAELLLWLEANFEKFSFDHVLGHDEVSPGRKVDPGASLSMSMPEFRRRLRVGDR